jgi:hypothetical protein
MSEGGVHQRQQYSSAATASSRRGKVCFHIIHYISEDLNPGHYAMLYLDDDALNSASDSD